MKITGMLKKRGNRGFTVVELMAATAVFSLMMVLALQLLISASKTTSQSSKQIEATDGARSALDAIARDIKNMVRTQGVTFVGGQDNNRPASDPNTDYLAFLTTGRAGSTSSYNGTGAGSVNSDTDLRYTGVCYRVDNIQYTINGSLVTGPAVIRLTTPVTWGDVNENTLAGLVAANALNTQYAVNNAFANTSPSTQTSVFTVAGERVVRMKIQFVWKQIPPGGSYTSPITSTVPSVYDLSSSQHTPDVHSLGFPVGTVDLSQLSAIIVGMVSIDQKTLQAIENNSFANISTPFSMTTLQSKFMAVSNAQTPVQVWKTNDYTSSTWAGVPAPIKSGVRYVQRIIPINGGIK